MRKMSLRLPVETEALPEPVNPWDALNSLKTELQASKVGGADPTVTSQIEDKISELETKLST